MTPTPWYSTFRAWFVLLFLASVAGFVLTVLTAPADTGNDPFDSPVLLHVIAVLAVCCGFAGWHVPGAGWLWGVVVAVPYFVGVLSLIAVQDDGDTAFLPLGLVILAALMAVPWLAGVLAAIGGRRR
jgi:putative membrane protein (TIGR04086 family)